jgi:hypothetical protein
VSDSAAVWANAGSYDVSVWWSCLLQRPPPRRFSEFARSRSGKEASAELEVGDHLVGHGDLRDLDCVKAELSDLLESSELSSPPWWRYRRARCSRRSITASSRDGRVGRCLASPEGGGPRHWDSRWNWRSSEPVRQGNKIDWLSVSSGRRSAQRTPDRRVTINDDRARAVLVSSADRPFKGDEETFDAARPNAALHFNGGDRLELPALS